MISEVSAEKNSEHTFYRKRIFCILVIFIAIICLVCFFNIQVDDERYYGLYEYEDISDAADLSGGVITVDEETGVGAEGVIARIPAMHIDAGTYVLDVDHQNDQDMEAVVYDGNKEIVRLILPAGEQNTRQTFTLTDNIYNLSVAFLYNGNGSVTVKRSILYSDGLFYTDTIFFSIIAVLMACAIAIVLIRNDVLSLESNSRMSWGVFLLFVIGISYPYYRPFWEPPVDAAFHISRIEGIYNEIIHGQYPVVLYSDALQGRGTIAALYPQLFLYIPVLFRMMHVSPEGSVRGLFIILNLATCGTSYYAAKKLTVNRNYALCAMMMYCLLPYRILSMTWRSAYGESQAFVFMPLVILGLYETILGDRRKWWLLAIGTTGIMQSHVISTMNTAIICVLAGIVFIHHIVKERRLLYILYNILAMVLLNLWYLFQFIRYIRSDISINEQMMTQDFSKEAYFFSRFFQFFPRQGADLYLIGMGLAILVLTASWLHISIRRRNAKEQFALFLILTGAAFVLMEMKEFPWMSLQKIQFINYITKMVKFPGRLSVISQPLLMFGAILTIREREFFLHRKKQLFIIALVLTVFQGYLMTDSFMEQYADPYISLTDARFKADIADQFSYDYVPSDYCEEAFLTEPESPDAIIQNYEHSFTHTEFQYTSDIETFVDLPLLYYLGYDAYQTDGDELKIEKNGQAGIRLQLPSTSACETVKVQFSTPRIWYGLFFISLMAWAVLVMVIIRSTKKEADEVLE